MTKKTNQDAVIKATKVKKRLLNAALKNPETLLIQYDNTYEGYDEEQIEDSLLQYGKNAITHQKKSRYGSIFWKRLSIRLLLFCSYLL